MQIFTFFQQWNRDAINGESIGVVRHGKEGSVGAGNGGDTADGVLLGAEWSVQNGRLCESAS